MEQITIKDFARIELKTAKVLSAERVPKADKLLLLKVDAGEAEPRQLIAGIGLSYEPEALVGKQVVIVANLAPATIRGVESNGMIIAASDEQGITILAPDREAVPGSRIG